MHILFSQQTLPLLFIFFYSFLPTLPRTRALIYTVFYLLLYYYYYYIWYHSHLLVEINMHRRCSRLSRLCGQQPRKNNTRKKKGLWERKEEEGKKRLEKTRKEERAHRRNNVIPPPLPPPTHTNANLCALHHNNMNT